MDDVKGRCCGVRFEPRGQDDEHILIKLLIEDDENWHKTGFDISSYWIDDLLSVLKTAKRRLENEAKKESNGFGYEFK